MVNEKRSRRKEIVRHVKDKCLYEYDVGDGWDHEILLEKILEPEAKSRYRHCLTGKRHCPPEDIQIVRFYAAICSCVGCVSFAFCSCLEERCNTSRLCTNTSKASSVRTRVKPWPEK